MSILPVEVALPGTILVLAFILKLLVNHAFSIPDFITSVLELPVDAIFLATTLVAGVIISQKAQGHTNLVEFILYILAAIIVTALWRGSRNLFFKERHFACGVVAILEIIMSAAGLVYAVNLMSGGSS